MSEAAGTPGATAQAEESPWRALGLLLAPAVTALGLLIAPRLEVGAIAAGALTFAGGAVVAIAPLAIASRGALGWRTSVAMAALGGASLLGLALVAPRSPWFVVAVNAAIVATAHAIGGAIGRRVVHPGHLLPACMVAAAADILSVVHPAGPTHAIVRSERALSVMAVHFAVPGTVEAAPVLGIGDLVFVALVLGVVAAHRLSVARGVAAAVIGIAFAGALSATLEAAVPALVTIALATVVALPEARRLRPADRRTTTIAAVLAVGLVVGVLVQRFLLR